MKYISLIFLLLLCSACTTTEFIKAPDVPVVPPVVSPLDIADIQWQFINKNTTITAKKDKPVFLLTDDQYKIYLSNLAEITRYIGEQRVVIDFYATINKNE